ncbi:MAG: hypothetical protein FJ313_03940, partial [Gemmatimonadetes bacterium]|nr:hypothetical protein [Gemmatimonadota bacterium]
DEAGAIQFAHPNLHGTVMVTAGAAGCRFSTLTEVNASDIVLPLRPILTSAAAYEVGDYVSGIDVNNGMFHAGDGNVDMAFVMPSLQVEALMSFDLAGMMGPPEVIEILGEQFEVPSNVFIPQQWELFVEIIKDHYYLYLPAGGHTLTAMSGRIPLDALLGGGDITQLLPLIDWRETDILPINVSGNMYNADLYVDPDLHDTVTMNLANVPPGSTTWCFSAGDLDNLAGLGRVIPLGLNSFACAGGGGACAGAVSLSTTAATGEFSGMGYFAAAAVDLTDTDDALVILDRARRPQTYTTNMTSFFRLLELGYDLGEFFWSDAGNPGIGSPPVHLHMARLGSTASEEIYWEFMIPGERLSFFVPKLPAAAPPSPAPGLDYSWEQVAVGLGYDLPTFDFNAFAFSDVFAHASHLAVDDAVVTMFYDPAGIGGTLAGGSPGGSAAARFVLASPVPNPCGSATALRFELDRPQTVQLAIHGVDGRRLATLLRGERGAGSHSFEWDVRDDRGRPLPRGVYLARLTAPGAAVTRTLVVGRR